MCNSQYYHALLLRGERRRGGRETGGRRENREEKRIGEKTVHVVSIDSPYSGTDTDRDSGRADSSSSTPSSYHFEQRAKYKKTHAVYRPW